MNPKHPIYIVSKSRWESRQTSRALNAMRVPHFMVVEQDQFDEYARVCETTCQLLILDKRFQAEYDTCDQEGDTKSLGPGPARNFAWAHSIMNGAPWHWVMDDNISGFYRFNWNRKIPIADGAGILAMEDFCERYENVAMAGPQYDYFIARKAKQPPFVMNTRIYSCNLIRNDLPYRWRGRYNEDTDLSLRMLKDGLCTVEFKAFLQRKATTQLVKGGNTDDFYAKEGTLPKSRMQVNLHPDVSRLTWKYGRWHHYVDYSGFRQRLKRKPDVVIPEGVNEYGMTYQQKIDGEWVNAAPA